MGQTRADITANVFGQLTSSTGVAVMAYTKFTDFNYKLGPSDCFMFTDENPTSINDGYLLLRVGSLNDRPAVNHDNASELAFADGHAAPKIWRDCFLNPANTAETDNDWLTSHATCPR